MAEKTALFSEENVSEGDDDTDDEQTPSSHPSPRFWHSSQLVEGNVYIRGGNIPKFKQKKEREHLTTTIEKFDVKERIWQQLETTEDHHPGLTGVACASFGKYLFVYGGNNSECLNGVLSQLNLDTLTWSQLSPETKDGPMRKDASGMVHFGEDSLAVVCGYAEPKDPTKYHGGSSDSGSRFIERNGPSADGGGRTNEMHIFNRNFKDDHAGWSSPSFSGPRPPPCADFSLTSVDLYRAILYGGRRGLDENCNDFYLIDFGKKEIMKIQPKNKEDKWPQVRLGDHAACCLGFNTENPQLLVSGGRLRRELPLKDIWILNLATMKWKEVKLPNDDIQKQLGRWGHTFTAVTHLEELVEVVMFGGSPGYFEVTWDIYKRKDFLRLSFPASFIFGFLDKEWKLLDVVNCESHWTSKTTKSETFDLSSHLMLDVLYSMEQNKIPVLTELMNNQKVRSTIAICSENTETLYKWPTFTKPSFHKPTWENLCLILNLNKRKDLVNMIKEYLKNKKVEDFELPGVDVCGETTFVVTNNADIFTWEGYGLELRVCEDALPKGMDKCKISVKASISGQYEFPKKFGLVSGVFWLRCEPACKFSKPITMKMEHCAKLENAPAKLSFIRSFCTKKKVTYIFEKIPGGHFNKADGTIELTGFSGVAVAGENPDREYCARIYYLSQPRITSYKIDFVVTLNTETHLAAVKKEYKEKDAQLDLERTFFFELDNITIDIPLKGINIEGGWKIVPLTNPVVLKQIVDNFDEGKVSPKCQFSATAMIPDGEAVPPLQHQAALFGAKPPDNIITFDITPPPIIAEPRHSSRKRPASESDATPAARRIHSLIQKSKSFDSSIPIIREDTSVDDIPSSSSQAAPIQHQLDIEDLQDIMEEVKPISAAYYALGRALRLHPGDLDRIRQENCQNTQQALNEVLLLWLRQSYDVKKHGPPTWEMLVEAVSKDTGGNNKALAKRIATNKNIITQAAL